jgi:hypothetical protein
MHLKAFRKIRHIFALVSVAAVIAFGCNAAVNLHYHVNSHGVIVFHAHPYTPDGNSGNPGHNHADSELNWLALLTSVGVAGMIVITAIVLPGMKYIRSSAFERIIPAPLSGRFFRFSHRGPPLAA